MSTRFTKNLDLNSTKLVTFDVPYYEQETYAIALATEQEYNDWYANEHIKPCVWVKKDERESKVPTVYGTDCLRLVTLACDHYGASHKRLLGEAPQRERSTTSKKVNCTVRLTANYLKNGIAATNYRWAHCNHDPTSIDEMVDSKLPDDVKQWIFEKVSMNMDWKSIKAALQMDENSLDEVNTNWLCLCCFI
jgi:hypothetical protein